MSEPHPFMHFNVIRDYRQKGKVEHKLMDIILLTICAIFKNDGNSGINSARIRRC